MMPVREPRGDAAGTRRRNRVMLAGFAICAFVFLVLPTLLVWVGSWGVCPSTITGRGTSDGTAWEISRNDCGGTVGTVWQMRVIPDRGYSAVVVDSRGGPEPVGWEQSGFEGTVILSAPPQGASSNRVILPLDPKGQPIGEVDVVNGERRDARGKS